MTLLKAVLAVAIACTSRLMLAALPTLTDTINPLPGPHCYTPLPLAMNTVTGLIYVTGGGNTYGSNGRVSVIDAQTNSVVAGFALEWGAETLAVNEATNTIYISTYTGVNIVPEIAVVNGSTNHVTHFNGDLGTTVLIDPVTGRLFSVRGTNDSVVKVYDGGSLTLLAEIQLTNGADFLRAAKMCLNSTSRKLYFGDGHPTIGVIDLDSLTTSPFIHTTSKGVGNLAVDPGTNRLFAGAVVSDGGGGNTPVVLVYNSASDALITSIVLTQNDFGVAAGIYSVGVAVDATRHRAYFSDDFYPNPVTHIIDTQNNVSAGSFPVPFSYGAVVPATGLIYATQYTSFAVPTFTAQNVVGRIDPANGSVSKVTTGYMPWNMELNPTTNRLYVSDQKGNDVLVFNTADHSLAARVPVGITDSGIRGLALSTALNRYYLTRANQINPDGTREQKLDVFDGATNQLTATVTLATGFINPSGFVAVDDSRRRIYVTGQSSDNQSTLFVVNADTNTLVTSALITPSILGLGVNPTNGHIYVESNNKGGELQVIDPTNYAPLGTIPTGRVPGPMAFDTQHNKFYVANTGAGSVDDTISVIDGATDSNIATISNINTQNSHDISSVAVDPATNTVFGGDSSNGSAAHGYVSVFNGANNYSYVGQVNAGGYPNRMLFDQISHELLVASYNTGMIDVYGNGVPAGPPIPPHGGLSETFFRVNGSQSPTNNVADSVLHFTSQQSGTPKGLVVHVQFNTTPDNNAIDWVDLINGSEGYMTLDKTTGQFVLDSTNYPLGNGIYFRALSVANGYPSSKSNVVGPFNLASSMSHLSPTTLFVATTGPGREMQFRANVRVDQATLSLNIQATTTPDDQASWAGLTDGRDGQMNQFDDPTRFFLETTKYPAGDPVYFRAVATTALGFVNSISNIVGIKNVVVGTPPTVEVLPPPPQAGSQSGLDPDHPIVASFGGFQIGATTSSSEGREIKKLGLIYDGVVIDVSENGPTNMTTQYTTTVPGDHVIKAFAIDDRGIKGFANPVYIRVKPASGKIFTLIGSGIWNDPNSWRDEDGNPGVPALSDLAVVGHGSVQVTQNVTALAVAVSGGTIETTTGVLFGVSQFFSAAGGVLKNMNLNINQSAVMSVVGDTSLAVSGLVTNNGTIRITGRGGIVPVPNGGRPATGSSPGPDLFGDAIGAFFKNIGAMIFPPPSVPPKPSNPPATPVPVPPLRGIYAQKFENSGLVLSGNGNGLVGNSGGTLSDATSTLISNDGASLITNDGGSIISNDGASIISNDGASIISNDGASRPAPAPSKKVRQPAVVTAAPTPGFIQTGGETDMNHLQLLSSVQLDGGTLHGSGVILGNLTNNSGFVSPGTSTGTIAVTGDFTQTEGGTLIVENGGRDFNQVDQLQITGTANLGGNLHVKPTSSYLPDPADTFCPLGYGAVTGSLAVSSNAQATMNGTGAQISLNPASQAPDSGQPLNISTRLEIQNGENVLIAGFIISGPAGSTKRVLIRGIGPSLAGSGVAGTIADPLIELHKPDGSVETNDNWQQASNSGEIPAGFSPTNDLESAIYTSLVAGTYTAVVKGAHSETGVGLVEVYDFEAASDAKLANLSTRGFVNTGDNVIIGGFIVGGSEPAMVLVRAIGPSLTDFGVEGALPATTLELNDANGSTIRNEGWRNIQESEIIATSLAPTNDREAAILATLVPGSYTAVVRGKNNTVGVGLVEAYTLR